MGFFSFRSLTMRPGLRSKFFFTISLSSWQDREVRMEDREARTEEKVRTEDRWRADYTWLVLLPVP